VVDRHEKGRGKKGEVGYSSLEKLFDIASYGKFSMGGQEVKGNFRQKVVICARVGSRERV